MWLRVAPYAILCILLASLIVGFGRVMYKEGQRDLLATIEKSRLSSIEDKQEVDNEIAALSDDELLIRALRWVRNPQR